MMNKEKWSAFWKEYDYPALNKMGYNIEKGALRKVFDEIGISKDTIIIDFGCGEGRTLSYLREFGFRNSIGVDNSMDAIRRCQQRGFKENNDVFFVGGKLKTKCDLLFSEGLLEHYKKKDLDGVINKMVQSADKYLFLVQPLTKSLTFRMMEFIERHTGRFWDYVNEYDYDIGEFIDAFKKHGFVPILIKTVHNLPQFLDTSIFLVFQKNKKKRG